MAVWKPALTFLCCLLVGVSALNKSTTCPTCNMKPYTVPYSEMLPIFVEKVATIWNQSIALTALGTSFVDLIKTLSTDPSEAIGFHGVAVSLLINRFIPYLNQEPEACAMAAMLNATKSCAVTRNRTLLQDALNELQDAYLNSLNPRVERTMVHKAGCDFRCGESPPDPKFDKKVCYQNGFVYPVREIWSWRSYNRISPSLRNIVLQMYNSSNFNDKFFAVCTTFALLGESFDAWSPHIAAEATDLTLSSRIEKKCCYQRIQRIEEIRKLNDQDAISYISAMRSYYVTIFC